MKTIDFFKGDNKEIVVALGFFDSIHIGHTEIIKKAQQVANQLCVDSAVFTFENDIDCFFGLSSGLVLTYQERLEKLSKLSVNTVISTVFTKEFSGMSASEFFSRLTKNFKVKAIVCGVDYRFGNRGLGDVDLLKNLCQEKAISLYVLSDVTNGGRRVSTTSIKQLLLDGELQLANQLANQRPKTFTHFYTFLHIFTCMNAKNEP
jgi:riboflavin kinase/FMN adenylyltransferase